MILKSGAFAIKEIIIYSLILFHLRWNNLREMVDVKRDDINVAHGFQNFNIECNETIVSHYA